MVGVGRFPNTATNVKQKDNVFIPCSHFLWIASTACANVLMDITTDKATNAEESQQVGSPHPNCRQLTQRIQTF